MQTHDEITVEVSQMDRQELLEAVSQWKAWAIEQQTRIALRIPLSFTTKIT